LHQLFQLSLQLYIIYTVPFAGSLFQHTPKREVPPAEGLLCTLKVTLYAKNQIWYKIWIFKDKLFALGQAFRAIFRKMN